MARPMILANSLIVFISSKELCTEMENNATILCYYFHMAIQVVLLVVGLAAVVFGAEYFIAGSTLIARKFGIPKLIIGLTIVALGTSAGEFGVSVISAIGGHNDIALGNVLGSNIANIMLIFAIALLFTKKIYFEKSIVTQMSVMTLISFGVLFLASISIIDTPNSISQMEGLFMLIVGLFYWFYLYNVTQQDKDRLKLEVVVEHKLSKVKSFNFVVFVTIASLVGLVIGSNLAIGSAAEIARAFNIPEIVIASTILAVGTSLPELVTSIQAVRQKQYEMMMGNIVGSNIMNTLFILSTSAIIIPLPISDKASFYLMFNIFVSVVLLVFAVFPKVRYYERWKGLLFLSIYAVFLFKIIFG
jgi:cation:H+ antiporter